MLFMLQVGESMLDDRARFCKIVRPPRGRETEKDEAHTVDAPCVPLHERRRPCGLDCSLYRHAAGGG